MKTTNKTNKAFNYDNTNNLRYDLNNYICGNLYADNITIQSNNKIYVFNWSYSPQQSGTIYQQLTYKNITTINKTNEIINHINKQNENI